ncbi:major facilitator superfamily domain-containing protein [Lactarius akahatsu]|uniref:Major facilitator superfamily domain-containing protein n=1 Tax=Lactarius akahatsu TaxID=416441 RepID=A0AAD4LER5_9AGAM|nr:major facilitator superfamily domain-containing protein [Lactarius akahatsu]
MSSPLHAMYSRDDKKQIEVRTSVDVVPDLGKNASTTAEKISAYFTIAAAALGLLSDGYQSYLMTAANVIFERLYPDDYTPTVATRVSNAMLVGALIGQLLIGLVCDRIGRKVALVFTTLLIVLGATLCTAAHGAHGSAKGLFWFLTFSRGLTGIGVGGEYPAASASATESANEQMLSKRGPVFVMVTNFTLTFGGPLASSVFLIVLSIVGENHLSTVWRICFGFGIFLPLGVLVFRLRMLSSELYRKGAIKRRVPYQLVFKRHWKTLIGTSGAWFIFDFVAFPNAIFSGTIISSVVHNGDIKKIAEWQLLLSSITLPGVVIGALLCNPLGRRNTAAGVILLVSAESYATPIRGTCYGLSAAIAKVGAVIGVQAFAPIQKRLGAKWPFIIAAIANFAGVLVTYFFVPHVTGADLADGDARFMKYLESNGWEGEVGEDEDRNLIGREPSTGSGSAINRVHPPN